MRGYGKRRSTRNGALDADRDTGGLATATARAGLHKWSRWRCSAVVVTRAVPCGAVRQ